MESGVFWSVHNRLDDKKRDKFHQFWGEVFERYILWLLEVSIGAKVNRLFPNPRYSRRDGDEVCDALILSEKCAVFIECKGSTFTAKGKYGGDPTVLDAELKKKFVGTDSGRKGVRQLVDAIQNLFSKDASDSVAGVNLEGIETIIPVLLTRDDIGSAFNSSAYLNFHFQELSRGIELARTVSPLCALSANDLECFAPYLVDVALSDALLAPFKADKDLTFPFWNPDNTILGNLHERPSPILNEEIKNLGDLCMSRLAPWP
jgi:hypothetical protein